MLIVCGKVSFSTFPSTQLNKLPHLAQYIECIHLYLFIEFISSLVVIPLFPQDDFQLTDLNLCLTHTCVCSALSKLEAEETIGSAIDRLLTSSNATSLIMHDSIALTHRGALQVYLHYTKRLKAAFTVYGILCTRIPHSRLDYYQVQVRLLAFPLALRRLFSLLVFSVNPKKRRAEKKHTL